MGWPFYSIVCSFLDLFGSHIYHKKSTMSEQEQVLSEEEKAAKVAAAKKKVGEFSFLLYLDLDLETNLIL